MATPPRAERTQTHPDVPFFDHRPEWNNWATVRWIFRRCQLYDFEKEVWYSYREAMQLGAS